MNIAGLQKTTLLDFPDCLACVVFSRGCNFRCPYCHNPSLVDSRSKEPEGNGDLQSLESFLDSRDGWLEGVVFSGGEPTLQEDLERAVIMVRRRKLRVKLDTNGSRPEILESLLAKNLLDYVALDVKAPEERYPAVTGAQAASAVRASLALLRSWSDNWEARTTLVPGLVNPEDVGIIARQIAPVPRYIVQSFRPGVTLDPRLKQTPSPHRNDLERSVALAAPHLAVVMLRSSGEIFAPSLDS